MPKGWGVRSNHGGGCGAQAGGAADCQLVEPALGNDANPAGLPIPLLNGANETPTGFTAGVSLGIASDNG